MTNGRSVPEHSLTREAEQDILGLSNILGDAQRCAPSRQTIVRIAVNTQFVTRRDNGGNEFGILLSLASYHEERGAITAVTQGSKNHGRRCRIRTIVESEANHRAPGLAALDDIGKHLGARINNPEPAYRQVRKHYGQRKPHGWRTYGDTAKRERERTDG